MLSLYELLSVPSDASTDEIKQAYKLKLLNTHPDKARTSEEVPVNIALIVDAYKILSNPDTRVEYDQQLELNLKGKGFNIAGGGLDVYNLDDFTCKDDSFVKTCPRCEYIDGFVLTEANLENGTLNADGGDTTDIEQSDTIKQHPTLSSNTTDTIEQSEIVEQHPILSSKAILSSNTRHYRANRHYRAKRHYRATLCSDTSNDTIEQHFVAILVMTPSSNTL
ncbi:DPH4 [Candida oxycetoniae]|uniref:DPH4 n=1 Tax=Candida oxycetoniae TaxID=497107 RepID=A0AAI9SSE1_9ASCO|nr:DPH4 [Candida oxycetoniae]KAI3402355.2 DPH4 [Candida oxycetoniae]